MKICPLCLKGKLVVKKVNFSLYSESLGRFKADVCDKCGEKFFDEESSNKIEIVAKKKGLYGLEAKTKISQLGNSVAVIVNKKLKKFMDMEKGIEVRVYPETKDKLVVEVVKII